MLSLEKPPLKISVGFWVLIVMQECKKKNKKKKHMTLIG